MSLVKCEKTITEPKYSLEIKLNDAEHGINRLQDETIIQQCTNDNNIVLSEKLGSGTYGYIYKAEEGNKEYAIKKIITKLYPSEEEYQFQEIEAEVEYGTYMSDLGIGPKVYRSFYITYEKEGENYIITYIKMGKYDYSLISFLNSSFRKRIKENAVKKCIDLIRRQVYRSNLYCIDIKPGNFVVNISKKTLDVKMIDFGSDYCKKEIDDLRSITCILLNYEQYIYDKKDILYLYNLLQFYTLLVPSGISNIILYDKLFNDYFIKNAEKNRYIITQVYKEGMKQHGDQCHFVWHYSNEMYAYYYDTVKNEQNRDIYDDMDPDLSVTIYEILYYYIDKDYQKNKQIKDSKKSRRSMHKWRKM